MTGLTPSGTPGFRRLVKLLGLRNTSGLEPAGRETRVGLPFLAALAVTATAYSNALAGPFTWDDLILIANDPAIHQIDVRRYFASGFWRQTNLGPEFAFYYRPLVTLSYSVDWALWGGAAAGFHLTNLLAHLGVTALVFALARRLGATILGAFAAAALFGTFPRATENVTWISGRTDVLASLGALGALLLYRPAPGGLARRLGAATALFGGLLAKEVAAAAAVAILVRVVRERRGRSPAAMAADLAPIVGACAAYAAIRTVVLAGSVRPDTDAAPLARVLLPLQALGRYAAMLLDPFHPRFGLGVYPEIEPGFVLLGIATVFGLALAAVRWGRRVSAEQLGVAAGSATALLLVLHIAPIRIHSIACDRFLYFPVAGLAALAAAALARVQDSRARSAWVAGATAAAFAFMAATLSRNTLWSDDLRLWSVEARRAAPNDGIIAAEYGNALYRAGDVRGALEQHRESELRFGRLRPLSPASAALGERSALTNVASCLSELGEYREGRRILEQIIAREPLAALHHLNIAIMAARDLDFDAAERHLEDALRLFPEYGEALAALDLVKRSRVAWIGLPAEAVAEAVDVTARRAELFAKLGRWHEAERCWSAVARASDARPDQVSEAAVYLVRRGDPAAAHEAIRRMEAQYGHSPETAALRQLIKDRGATTPGG